MGSTGKTSTSSGLRAYRDMSVSDAADFVYNAPKNTDPELNSHEVYQDMVNALGLHGKPIVLDDKSFDDAAKRDALDGAILWRGLGDQVDTAVADSVKFGDKFYVGNGLYGGGLYFTDDYGEASVGYSNGDPKTSILMAYIDKNKAKVIDGDALKRMFASEPLAIQKKFAKFGTKAPYTDPNDTSYDKYFADMFGSDGFSAYAMYKGYNTISINKTDYNGNPTNKHYVALTREPLVFRDNVRGK